MQGNLNQSCWSQ